MHLQALQFGNLYDTRLPPQNLNYRLLTNKPICIKKWIFEKINLEPLGSEATPNRGIIWERRALL